MSRNILFINVDAIKARTNMHGNIDAAMILPEIKVVQDMQMEKILGSALYNKLQNDIEANTLTGIYATLVNTYLIDCLIWYVLSELPLTLSMQVFNKGVVRSAGQDIELPSLNDLVAIQERYRNRAEHYMERTKRFLIEESSKGNFPEYINPGNRADTIFPYGGTFSLPISLHDDRNVRCKDWNPRENISQCNI
jgi:hypothetical protein